MKFEKLSHESKLILTEGGIVERLKSEFNLQPDSAINHAGFIYDNPEILELLYRQYIEIGIRYDLPIMMMTPTRKVNFESLKNSQYSNRNVIADSCTFLNKIKGSYPSYLHRIFVGGLMGCKGDAYSSINSPEIEESYRFHQQQALQFQKEKIDFLFAGIMPAINEAIGMAKAMAETKIPYIISFMVRKEGCLIDGTTISEAISIIDNKIKPKPLCYMVNCIHPGNLIKALKHRSNINQSQLKRLTGIQANASMLSPEELNNCEVLIQDDFDNIIEQMIVLHKQFNFKMLGGCCGTNDKFMNDLSARIKSIKK
jgi:S-methylmethionine-dependent homocysteine/selenocysteine methylase